MFVKDRSGKYCLFNKAAARFVGKPVEEVLGKDDTAIFDPESARIAMEQRPPSDGIEPSRHREEND